MYSIGVVILNYNTTDSILEFYKKFKEYKNVEHFVIVDNCSTDGKFEKLKKIENEKIDVINSGKNGGYAYGNNYGAKYLIEKYNVDLICILNPDTYFEDEDMLKIKEAFSSSEYVMLGAKTTDMEGNFSKRQYWKIPKFKDELFDCFFITRKIKKKNDVLNISSKEKIVEVPVIPGCFFVIKSDVLKEIGYLDENTFLYYEENILASKLEKRGYKRGIITDVVVKSDRNNSSTNEISKNGQNLKFTIESKKYYHNNYLNLNTLQKIILDIGMKFSIFENKIIIKFKNNKLVIGNEGKNEKNR